MDIDAPEASLSPLKCTKRAEGRSLMGAVPRVLRRSDRPAQQSGHSAPEAPSITVTYTLEDSAELLDRSDNILILTHVRPDGDTLGSASALCLALRSLEKTAYILSNPETTPKYAWLVNGLTPPADFEPETVISVDVADKALLPENHSL